MYNCKYCGKEFRDKGNLRKHEKYQHEESAYKFVCPHCGKALSHSGYSTHIPKCRENPDRILTANQIERMRRKILQSSPGNCKYCDKEYKNQNSLHNHEIRCKLNPNRKLTLMNSIEWQEEMRSRIDYSNPWNKGLTKYTDDRVANGVAKVKEYYVTHPGSFKGKHHRDSTRQLLSNQAKERGYASHFGTCCKIYYNGIGFQSSYEVKVAQSLDKYNIKWVKPKRLKYTDPMGNHHYYTADLYLLDYDIYLDPKNDFLISNINPYFGYKDKDKIKWVEEQNGVKIIILNKHQLDWPSIELLINQLGG